MSDISILGGDNHSDSTQSHQDSSHSTAAFVKTAICDPSVAKMFSGIEHGSAQAKQLWAKVNADAHSPEMVAKAKAVNAKATGWYNSKPLVPGEKGSAEHPQADWDFMRDRLVLSQGLDPNAADRVCSAISHRLYPH